ncbi:MAG TPA: hypothetical protein GXX54_04595 [Clostridiales bacterium]|nr:hypothetical protein [Clostridiales bacterium]
MLRKLAFLKKPQLSLQKSRSFRCKKAAAFAAKKPQLSLRLWKETILNPLIITA